MLTNESSLMVYFIKRFHGKFAQEKCMFLEILETITH